MNAASKYNRLSKDDAVALFVDHQSGLISLVQDYPPGEFKNNVLALASLAKFLSCRRFSPRVLSRGLMGLSCRS
jgi:hypothetical protein